jgi:unsaturated chondroitin disaccharide hydrolase
MKNLKKRTFKALFVIVTISSVLSCQVKKTTKSNVLEVASQQYDILYDSIQSRKDSTFYIPRSIENGIIKYVQSYDWTSGFYAGSLWYLYDLTGEAKWKERALTYTLKLDSIQHYTKNHDLGFMIECSYGNAIKFDYKKEYDKVLVESAKSLATRFREKAGIIQSWDAKLHFEEGKWKCPVIIDNMMNLELLLDATKISGDSTFYNIAVSHADNTLKNHFRKDNSSFHVVDYDVETGKVIKKTTHQGFSDDSAWARGQAWGLYGFTVMYRGTQNPKYLDQAIKIASFIQNHPKLPKDQVPYWDYDVKIKKTTPRDASAAAVTASALLELSKYVDQKQATVYKDWAKKIIDSLGAAPYLAEIGTNKGYILQHSVGVLPYNKEIDVPLNYADYYYLEALSRLKNQDQKVK